MIMVLSQNFLRSDWCILEFRSAHYRVMKERSNYLIVILLDEISMGDLDEDLKLYMKTNTYLSVENKWFWDKLRYAMPQHPLSQLQSITSLTSKAALSKSSLSNSSYPAATLSNCNKQNSSYSQSSLTEATFSNCSKQTHSETMLF